jgi:hypothetical protein
MHLVLFEEVMYTSLAIIVFHSIFFTLSRKEYLVESTIWNQFQRDGCIQGKV